MTPAPTVIELDAVSKTFGDGRRPALDGVSLAVHKGEFLVVIGGSGAGKTTLLRLINRLIDPSGGTVLVEGADVREVDPVALRRRIGYVFQGIGLFPHMSVAENVGITLSLLGWEKGAIEARVTELL